MLLAWFVGACAWGAILIVIGVVAIWAFERRRPRLGESLGLLGLATVHGSLWFFSVPATLAGLAWNACRRRP